MGLLDFVFPKYCVNCRKIGSYLCSDCFSFLSFNDFELCLNCSCSKPSIDGLTHPYCRGRYVIDGCFSSLSYKGVVKKLIYNFKYKPYLSDLKNVLVDLFYEGLIQKELFDKICRENTKNLMIIPIPLYSSRLKKRGYNHAELLATGLSNKLGIQVASILDRVKSTKSQVGLKKEERKENIKDAFAVSSKISLFEKLDILLVDDVLTTGSTLLEAAGTLKRNGVKRVWGITLARD